MSDTDRETPSSRPQSSTGPARPLGGDGKGTVLQHQGYHLLGYVVLGGILAYAMQAGSGLHGRAWGLSTAELVAASWVLAGIFQFGGALVWRLELYHGAIQKWFGRAGFIAFGTVFPVVGITRMLLVIPIAQSTRDGMTLHPALFWTLILVPMPLILWACHSVLAYFSFRRAIGADHFDPSYRNRTLETRGIFKYIRNPMYAVILLLIYHPGLFFESWFGLLAAACHHSLVWLHYFCTEKPDLREIYGPGA